MNEFPGEHTQWALTLVLQARTVYSDCPVSTTQFHHQAQVIDVHTLEI